MPRDTTPTANRGYDRPEIGADWAAAWDYVVEDLDANALFEDSPHDNTAHSETYAVDGDAQPPETHDNTAHSPAFVSDGDGTERQIWIIASGESDPAGADPEDLIFEEQ